MKWLTDGSHGSAVACFLALLLGGLIVLAIVGRRVSETNYLPSFSRFHQYINPSTFYYPTASQVVALARDASQDDAIVVVIGGSSVMWGAGQPDANLWSHALQRALGDRYRVLNLATLSGSPQEHGGVAFQYLFTRTGQVIYLTDLGSSFGSPDGLFYPYVYWDAYYKGYLVPNPDAMPLIEGWSKDRTTSPPLDDLRVQGALDSVLYFTDLWNAVGYHWLFTTWSFLVYPPAGHWFAPRAQFTDPQPGYPDEARFSQPPFEVAMNITRSFGHLACPVSEFGTGSRTYVEAYWKQWDAAARVALPEAVRRNMLITRFMHARPYRDQLSADERLCYTRSFDETSDRLRALGYGAVVLGKDWTAEDYIDVVHPSVTGAERMAAEIALLVQDMAGRLGYLEEP